MSARVGTLSAFLVGRGLWAVSLGLAAAGAIACRTPEIADPQTNYGDASFQILAPSTGRWVKLKLPEGQGVAFRKESAEGFNPAAERALGALAQFGEVDREFRSKEELLESIKRAKIAQASFGALSPIQNEFRIAKFKTADCLLFKQKMNDAGKTRSVNDDLILYVEGMTCLHPKNSKKFVNMEFSQKYPRRSEPLEDSVDKMSYFNSLTFR